MSKEEVPILRAMEEARTTLEYSWPILTAQIVTVVSPPLFIAAAWMTLKRGKGTEVPLWMVADLLVPIIVPIVALVRFPAQGAGWIRRWRKGGDPRPRNYRSAREAVCYFQLSAPFLSA